MSWAYTQPSTAASQPADLQVRHKRYHATVQCSGEVSLHRHCQWCRCADGLVGRRRRPTKPNLSESCSNNHISTAAKVYTVSQKRIHNIIKICNLKMDYGILIIFPRNIPDTVTQLAIKWPFKFPPHRTPASAPPGKTGTLWPFPGLDSI